MADKELFGISEQLETHDKRTETHACDLISRQAAIDLLNDVLADYIPFLIGRNEEIPLKCAVAIRRLPSAQQERKKGKWIYNSPVTMKCNQCGFVIKDWDWHRFKYCPNCIADMRGENDG